jgi:hypothetical protein
MHGPSLIVAERGETHKKVSAESLSLWGRKRLKTASFALVLPCSQVLHELSHDETNTSQ